MKPWMGSMFTLVRKNEVEIEEIYDEISLTVEINRNAEKKV